MVALGDGQMPAPINARTPTIEVFLKSPRIGLESLWDHLGVRQPLCLGATRGVKDFRSLK